MNRRNVKPNIVLIILDAARKDMFGCYGNTENLTPHIDALAREGLVLRNHYAAGCGSAQAHTSIFTGQHSIRHKMVHNFCDLKSDIVTLSLLLKKLGYKTFGYTKFGVVPPAGHEKLFGFDELIDPEKERKTKNTKCSGRDRIKRIISINPRLKQMLVELSGKITSKDSKLRARANSLDGQECLDYLFVKIKENAKNRPVFAYTSLAHPHMPYYPPRRFLNIVFKKNRIHSRSYDIQLNVHAYLNGNYGETPEAIDSIRKCYKANLLYADYMIGEFIENLKRESLLENTILIIMPDHGELLGEHGEISHGSTVWEELFDIPSVIHYPERIKPGSSIDSLTSTLDIFPSIFDLIDEKSFAEEQTILDGVSVFQENYDWKNRYLVVDSPPLPFPERLKKYKNLLKKANIISRALKTQLHKYIWQSNNDNYLFKAGSLELPENNLLAEDKNLERAFLERMVKFYISIEPGFKIDEYPIRLSKKIEEKIADPYIRNELVKLGYLTEEEG